MPLRFWRFQWPHWGGLLCLIGAGLFFNQCSHSTEPANDLGPVSITRMRLTLLDPELGLRGVRISFQPSDPEGITAFQLFLSMRADSMGAPIQTGIANDQRTTLIALPDSSPPFTVYLGLRSLRRLETGETWQSEEMPLDSLVVLAPPLIHSPANGDTLGESSLRLEVSASTDQGLLMRQTWWEKEPHDWTMRLDTCLPRNDCETPFFGAVQKVDTVVLNFAATSPKPAVVCVLGSEVFDGRQTAQRQSLACSRFYRKSL